MCLELIRAEAPSSHGHLDKARWRVISPLLDQLLDTDPGGRTARLDRIRRGDPLLAEELGALLSQETAVDREAFLEGNVLQAEASLQGQTVGNYTLESTIGHGGMGSVWLARRSDGRFEGKAAVKFLHLALMTRGGADHFQREGSFLARLAHPHIACLLDAGVTRHGQPYLVLEYVDGEPIDRWCDARALTVEARVRLFIDVLAAVAHAHNSLILHRDLKPSNILVTKDGQVKLLDFGIAKLLDDSGTPSALPELTLPAGRAFTPDFAAPEQVQARGVTTATDVYALGVLLYLLLSGQHPTATNCSTPIERMQAVVDTEPSLVSAAVSHGTTGSSFDPFELADVARRRVASSPKLARLLRGDLDNIVAKALKKAPAERYENAMAMAEDLRRYLNHEPVGARADSARYRAAKFLMRHLCALGASAAIVLALSAGAAVATWQALEANDRRAQAELEAKRAVASMDLLYLMYSDAGAASASRTLLERLAMVRQVIRRNAQGPEVKLTLLMRLAEHLFELNAFDRLFDVLDEMRKLLPGVKDPAQHANVACGFVHAYANLGRLDAAAREMALAAPFLRQVHGEAVETRAECWRAASQLALLSGDFDLAVRDAKQSVETFERLGQTLDARYLTALTQLSIAYASSGDFRQGYLGARAARTALIRQGLQNTQKSLILAMQEAQLLAVGGKPLASLRLTDEIRADRHVAVHREIPQFLIDERVGTALLRLHRHPDALAALDAGIEGAQAAGNLNFAQGIDSLAILALAESGRADEARSRLNAMPETGRSGLNTVRYLIAVSAVALVEGTSQQADETSVRAVKMVHADTRYVAQRRGALNTAADAAMAVSDWPRALAYAQEAIVAARAEAIDANSSSSVGEALLLEAQALSGLGQRARAADFATEALPHLQENLGPANPKTAEALALAAR